MLKTQVSERADAIYNGRPLHLTGPPLSVFHAIFQAFRSKFADIPAQLPLEHLQLAHALIEISARYYGEALERQSAMRSGLEKFLNCHGMPTKFLVDGHQFEADVNRPVNQCGVYTGIPPHILSLIGEYKNDIKAAE
jgi:hypothetical protein